MKRTRYIPPKRPKPTSLDDILQKSVMDTVVKGMVENLRPLIIANPGRTIESIKPDEMLSLAYASVEAFNEGYAHAERMEAIHKEMNDPVDDLYAELLGAG